MFDFDLRPFFYGFIILAIFALYGIWQMGAKPKVIIVKEVNGTKLYCPKGFKLIDTKCVKTIKAKEIK